VAKEGGKQHVGGAGVASTPTLVVEVVVEAPEVGAREAVVSAKGRRERERRWLDVTADWRDSEEMVEDRNVWHDPPPWGALM